MAAIHRSSPPSGQQRLGSNTVICLDSSSPRFPSPSSFLVRTGATRPVFRRGSTRSTGSDVAANNHAIATAGHEVVTISSSSSSSDGQRRLEDGSKDIDPCAPSVQLSDEGAHGDPCAPKGRPAVKRKRATKLQSPISTTEPPRKRSSLENADEVGSAFLSEAAEARVHAISKPPAMPKPAPRKTTVSRKKNLLNDKGKDSAQSAESKVKPARKPRATVAKKARKQDAAATAMLTTLRATSTSQSPQARLRSVNIVEAVTPVHDAAPLRRRSWTPVADVQSVADEEGPAHAGVLPGKFTSILRQYSFEDQGPVVASAPALIQKPSAMTKRELEGVQGVPAVRKQATSKTKTTIGKDKPVKAIKTTIKRTKKPVDRLKNVTDHALAPYRPNEPQDSLSIQALLAPKPLPAEEDVSGDDDENMVPNVDPPLPSVSGTGVVGLMASAQIGLANRNKVKMNVPEPKEAQDLLQHQDFVFGTSSQLAKDDSPTILRQIQQAIQDSEETAYMTQQSAYSPTTSRSRVVAAPHGTTLSIGPSEGGMWSVAARDQDNRTLAAEVRATTARPRALSETSERGTANGPIMVPSSSPAFVDWTAKQTRVEEQQDSGFVEVSLTEEQSIVTDGLPSDGSYGGQTFLLEGELDEERCVLRDLDGNISPSKPAVVPPELATAKAGTDHVATAMAKTMSKPRRQAGAGAGSTESVAEPVKKPRGRPRKEPAVSTKAMRDKITLAEPASAKRTIPVPIAALTATKSFGIATKTVDDILDSDNEFDADASRQRMSSVSPSKGRSPKPLTLSQTTTTTTPNTTAKGTRTAKAKMYPTQAEKDRGERYYTDVFPQITSTVKAAPMTTNPKHPSWHEKILLYDPIVLEDLTDWLNQRGLRVSYTRPVPVAKAMKTAKKSTAVHLGDGVASGSAVSGLDTEAEPVLETVFNEIEPWMTQKWCESQSICCVWRDGLRGGIRARY